MGFAGCTATKWMADYRNRSDEFCIGGRALRRGDRDHGSERESGGGDIVRMQSGADGPQERGGGGEWDSNGIVVDADLWRRWFVDAARREYAGAAAAVAAGWKQQHGGAERRMGRVRIQRRVSRFLRTGAERERRVHDP